MIPGLVAHYLTQCDSPNYADLKRSVCAWIELFGDDFHLHSDASYTQDRLDGFLNGLHTLEFLHFGDERIQIEQKMQGSGRLKKIAKFSAGARQFYANVLDSLNGLEKLDERTLEAKLSAVAESIHEDNPGSESSTFQKFFSIEKNLESWTEKEILDKSGRLTPHGKQLMQAARILA